MAAPTRRRDPAPGAYGRVESYVKSFKEPLTGVMREIDPGQIALNWSETSETVGDLTQLVGDPVGGLVHHPRVDDPRGECKQVGHAETLPVGHPPMRADFAGTAHADRGGGS